MFEHDTLSLIWFALLGFLLVGYAILDGFDFGVGILSDKHSRPHEEASFSAFEAPRTPCDQPDGVVLLRPF